MSRELKEQLAELRAENKITDEEDRLKKAIKKEKTKKSKKSFWGKAASKLGDVAENISNMGD